MGWFRPKIRLAAWLALAALALNLVFAFSHHHFDGKHAHASAEHAGAFEHIGDGDEDHHGSTADHLCLTCAILSAPAVAANPPALPAQARAHMAESITTITFGPRRSDRTSFEARAPPCA